jgi:long-chain acyl-CoA synthetase
MGEDSQDNKHQTSHCCANLFDEIPHHILNGISMLLNHLIYMAIIGLSEHTFNLFLIKFCTNLINDDKMKRCDQSGISMPTQNNHLAQQLTLACKKHANKPAWTAFNTTTTYTTWQTQSDKLAWHLTKNLKLKPTTRIALMLPNCAAYPIVFLAALKAGLVIVNLNPLDQPPALMEHLNDSGCHTLITASFCLKKLTPILKNTQLKNIVTSDLSDEAKGLTRLIIKLSMWWRYGHTLDVTRPNLSQNNLLTILKRSQHLEPYPFQPTQDDDLAFIQYTSGTTGKAKGVMLTQQNITSNLKQIDERILPMLKGSKQPTVLTVLPLYHIFALMGNLCVFSRMGAHQILIPNGRDLASISRAFKQNKIEVMSGVNTLFQHLLNHASFKQLNHFSLKLCIAGGMALNKETAESWLKHTKCNIKQAYGLSETSPAVSIQHKNTSVFSGDCGTALSDTEVSIRNDKGEKQPINQHGEIWIRGPQVMKGYWHNPKATQEAITDDGWFKTGDIGYLDQSHALFIVDRCDDIMNVSGFNVAPREIEEALMTHPDVLEIAVFGTADKEHGTLIHAQVVPTNPSTFKPSTIEQYAHQLLAGYKVPHHIVAVINIPKNNLGKPDKKKLKSDYLKT